MSQPPSSPASGQQRGIAGAAGILALGNVSGRILGLVREQVIAYFFGASGLVSVFGVADTVRKMLFELLVGGMLSAALVPVFSQVEEQDGRPALWALLSRMTSLVAVVMAALVLVLELLAPQVAGLLGGGFSPELQTALAQMLRILAPALLLVGLSGVLTGLLYTLKRFTLPAFGAAVFNLGIVIAAPLLAGRLDAYSLAVGVLLGSLLQLLILAPGLRDARLRFRLDLRHPAVRRILILYLPIALGLVVSSVQIGVDRRLASGTGDSSIAWMDRATTLFQLPHGLVAVAISLAVLPTLSRLSAAADREGFRQTLAQGLRLALVLIIPATAGLLILSRPTVGLLFEHGKFGSADANATALALRCYLLGLVFATVDWPLNYAFYARQDTLTPALVGLFSVGVYLSVALPLVGPLGFLGLVLADSAKQVSHAVVMLYLAHRRLGGMAELGLARTAGRTLLAAGGMAGLMLGVRAVLTPALPGGLPGDLILVAVVGGVGALTYLALVAFLRVEEVHLVLGLLRRRERGQS